MRSFEMDLSSYEGVEGKIELFAPGEIQRLKMSRLIDVPLDKNGRPKTENKEWAQKHPGESVDMLIRMLEATKGYFKSVHVKLDDIEAKSYEELESYPEFSQILYDAAGLIMQAGRLGKSK